MLILKIILSECQNVPTVIAVEIPQNIKNDFEMKFRIFVLH